MLSATFGKMTDIERAPDITELRQWTLLKRLHESDAAAANFGKFLKENGFPHDSTQKPWGKYYTHIRKKNLQILELPSEQRIQYIEERIDELSDKIQLSDVKQIPSINRAKLIDVLAGLSLEGKRKMISVLKDLTAKEQGELIGILGYI